MLLACDGESHKLKALTSLAEAPQATPISSRPVNAFEADRPDEAGAGHANGTAQALLGRTPGPPALQSCMTMQLTCATLQGLHRAPRSEIMRHILGCAAQLLSTLSARAAQPMHLCIVTSHTSLSTCVMGAAGAEQLAGLWMWGVREADMTCSRCGMAGHNARNLACPMRAFTGEQTAAPAQPPGPGPRVGLYQHGGLLPSTSKCPLRHRYSSWALPCKGIMAGRVAEGRCTMRAVC